VVAENYPQLKSDANFRDLQAQLEGTENRIAVARNRYIKAVQEYNVLIRQFPVNLTAMMFSYQTKPNFASRDEKAIAKPRRRLRQEVIPMLRRWVASIAAGTALLLALPAAAEVAVPPIAAHVTDLTGTLSGSQIQALESRLRDFERAKGSQLAVLLLPRPSPRPSSSTRSASPRPGRSGGRASTTA